MDTIKPEPVSEEGEEDDDDNIEAMELIPQTVVPDQNQEATITSYEFAGVQMSFNENHGVASVRSRNKHPRDMRVDDRELEEIKSEETVTSECQTSHENQVTMSDQRRGETFDREIEINQVNRFSSSSKETGPDVLAAKDETKEDVIRIDEQDCQIKEEHLDNDSLKWETTSALQYSQILTTCNPHGEENPLDDDPAESPLRSPSSSCSMQITTCSTISQSKVTHSVDTPYTGTRDEFGESDRIPQRKRARSVKTPCACKECGKAFSDSHSLRAHKRTHSRDTPRFVCDECSKTFTFLCHLLRHKRTHSGETPYTCDECGKSFRQSDHLKGHKRIHSGECPYICDECGKAFKLSHSLLHHKRTHSGETPYVCDECGKAFKESGHLRLHKRTHSGETPYKCDECGKSFSYSKGLVSHRRTHSGETPYACDECGKAFRQSSTLIQHKRTHSGETPYVCNECGKAFSQSSTLTQHKRTHSGETPYLCNECGQSFTRSSSLARHKRRHLTSV